jgi:hypothetical protein
LTRQIDRKEQHVRIAEYRYRHEAELAAGFLSDAGIPFRLQVDDAGGADLGLSMLRPAILWVRAVDAEDARMLVAPDETESAPAEVIPLTRDLRDPASSRLRPLERAVSVGLAVALLAVAPNLPPSQLTDSVTILLYVVGVVLLGVAALGWAPGHLGGLIRVLSGSHPHR